VRWKRSDVNSFREAWDRTSFSSWWYLLIFWSSAAFSSSVRTRAVLAIPWDPPC